LFAAAPPQTNLISSPEEAINVMDFEEPARKALPPAHWGYLTSGVEDDATLRANRDGFNRYYLRPRRLIDTGKVDSRTTILGMSWPSPIGLAPIGNMSAFHADAELHVARATKRTGSAMVLSTYTNSPIREVTEVRGAPVWFQLYPQSTWQANEALVRLAEDSGSPAIVLTVDVQTGRRTETFDRWRKLDTRDCRACHGDRTRPDFYRRKAMFRDLDKTLYGGEIPLITWEGVRRLRKFTTRKLVIKGIESPEDARLSFENGADGVVVSNHGGRAGETGRASIECLEEVVDAVRGRGAVLVDGGFRRGSDVFKALALGAQGVLVGRPYLWGLAAFGEPGVHRVVTMLQSELELVMKQCGVSTIAQIGSAYVGRRQA
jgi:isopentenyl diphosphate isomerase/L-lactate dehydrogenase-like FMN-dependent dehydrogenase